MVADLIRRLSVVTAPSGTVVSTAEAKASLRLLLSVADEDDVIEALIQAATDRIEAITGRALLTQTWDLKLDRWPSAAIDVPKPNLRSVTSITYVDAAGATQTWTSSLYQVSAPSGATAERGRIVPAYGQTYPTLRPQMDAVTVRFSAGYGTSADVPAALKQAALLMVGEWYDSSRSGLAIGTIVNTLPHGVDALLMPYRSPSLRMG